MTCRLAALCFDANDPVGLAGFWAEALRWEMGEATDTAVAVIPTDGTRFRLLFNRVTVTKEGKNRTHLDLTTSSRDDQKQTVERLLELGADHVDVGQGPAQPHVVLADPEGNELCVIEPDNSFLAGRDRLGSITCDGSPQAGYFWSAALGWPLVWDQDEETAIREPDGTGPFITWGPPVPAPAARNRLHLHIAPADRAGQRAEVERLISLGASRIRVACGEVGAVVMADPDGNEFSVVEPPPA